MNFMPKNAEKYVCKKCDFKCSKKSKLGHTSIDTKNIKIEQY